MSWEKRGDKRYYDRTERRDGRSVRRYYDSGEIAELAATAETLLHVQREVQDRQTKREQEPVATAEAGTRGRRSPRVFASSACLATDRYQPHRP